MQSNVWLYFYELLDCIYEYIYEFYSHLVLYYGYAIYVLARQLF